MDRCSEKQIQVTGKLNDQFSASWDELSLAILTLFFSEHDYSRFELVLLADKITVIENVVNV